MKPESALLDRSRARCHSVAALVAAALLVLIAGAGQAAAQEPGSRGAQMMQSLQRGATSCDQLDAPDFEAMGEFLMGRMVGSPQSHESMDRMMSAMMGSAGEDRMHELMGRRFAGCGGGTLPGGAGAMMNGLGGMMGMMGMAAGRGGESAQGYGPGMMGSDTADDDDDDSEAGWLLLLAALVVVGLAAVGLFAWRRLPGPADPSGSGVVAILDRRLASGEIDRSEYQQRRRLLEEGR